MAMAGEHLPPISTRQSPPTGLQPGVMQLVPRAMHQGSTWQPLLHPGGVGGFKLWGADF
jgi:hypothetical protein